MGRKDDDGCPFLCQYYRLSLLPMKCFFECASIHLTSIEFNGMLFMSQPSRSGYATRKVSALWQTGVDCDI